MGKYICPYCGNELDEDVCIEEAYFIDGEYDEYVRYYDFWCYQCDREIVVDIEDIMDQSNETKT